MKEKEIAKNILGMLQGEKIFIFNEDRTKYEEITKVNPLYKAIIGMLVFILHK